jgi:hypothetical protein
LPPTDMDEPSETVLDCCVSCRWPVSRIVAFSGVDVPRGSTSSVALSAVVPTERCSVTRSPVNETPKSSTPPSESNSYSKVVPSTASAPDSETPPEPVTRRGVLAEHRLRALTDGGLDGRRVERHFPTFMHLVVGQLRGERLPIAEGDRDVHRLAGMGRRDVPGRGMLGRAPGVASRTRVTPAPNLDVRDRRMIGWATLAGVVGRPTTVAVPISIFIARRPVTTSVTRVLIATACGCIGAARLSVPSVAVVVRIPVRVPIPVARHVVRRPLGSDATDSEPPNR